MWARCKKEAGLVIWRSSPASWICSWQLRVQILYRACKVANWFTSYQLGFSIMLCSVMCNQMVYFSCYQRSLTTPHLAGKWYTCEIREYFHLHFVEILIIPPRLCYLLISRVAHYDHNHRFLTVFIELIINEKLHAMNMLELKFFG